MSMLNEKALASLENLDASDKAYCLSLSKRLEAMGLSPSMVSSAVATLAENDNVPSFIPCAATPSLFATDKHAAAEGQKAAQLEGSAVLA